jgi:hypothetical protein
MNVLNTLAAIQAAATFSSRSNAARDARKHLGSDKISGVHFRVSGPSANDRFTWEAMTDADQAAAQDFALTPATTVDADIAQAWADAGLPPEPVSPLALSTGEAHVAELAADAAIRAKAPKVKAAPKAKKAAKAKVAAAKAPKAAKVKAPAKPLFLGESTIDGVLVKASARMPKAAGKTLRFSARWKTAGGNDNLGAWHDDAAKAVEQAKVHLADGRQAWVISGYR